MKDAFDKYINSLDSKFSHEETSEYGYRTDFELLLKDIFESIKISRFDNDPKAKAGNKPDFVVIKNDVPLLYIETKDIGTSLDKVEKSQQMSRYFGYENLILTDYLEFRFYRNGLPYGEPIKIAGYDLKNRVIAPKPESYEYLTKTILDFTQSHKETIKSGQHLAKIMGGKGQRIRDNIREVLNSDSGKSSELMSVYETIKRLLVHDLTIDSFADMYAQTLVYGLFVARFYDDSLDTFTRQEARDLIPASNPFLGHFFDHIAGRNFEKRLSYIVDELCEVFSHANVADLMEQHFKVSSKKGTQRGQDQVIHFYEDFLKEYDEELRKKMGAYYTPLPVVQFIVRSVDFLLEKEFDLSGGLANTSKTKDGVHKVQVLDPAVGTGTFISDVIGKIYTRVKSGGQKGRWPAYVHHDLLPRIFGFELMMAPYTIAHLKLSMALKETGFLYFNETRTGKARLGIYLTNSLEEVNKQPQLLAFDFGASIAEEAEKASKIKNEKPIMVVLGNPPYSVSSSNKGEWIQQLVRDYKEGLGEKSANSLSDDYIKFIRFAEHFIEKNNSGIVAMITNNSFVDGITHRQMRKHLLQTFDDIYILNLHGNAKKKEVAPDGGKDENVFDIQQGVSINIFVKKEGEKKSLGKVHHTDIFGERLNKFDILNKNNLKDIKWQNLVCTEPYYFFVPKDFSLEESYSNGFKIDELFIISGTGIKTNKDKLLVDFSRDSLIEKIEVIRNSENVAEINNRLQIQDGKYWSTAREKEKLLSNKDSNYHERPYLYRPFDNRWVYYQPNLIEIGRGGASKKVMGNMFRDNLCLISTRQLSTFDFQHIFATRLLSDMCAISLQTKETSYAFPLYIYNANEDKISNLKESVVEKIESIVGKVSPENIFDYVYVILHSPKYRNKYKEFLKIDFPRVPYPKDKEAFKKLVELGHELRELHLLESTKVNKFITTYPVAGSDTVEKKPKYVDGKVYLNDNQYFGNVPEVAWNFWIGGYQPAQKWLKDRKDRTLTNEDIEHYQKMIVALIETDQVMKNIDKISI